MTTFPRTRLNPAFFTGGAATASFTPAAEAFSANDVMGGAQEFAGIGPTNGGEVIITSASLMVAHTGVISGETGYLLYLYNVTPPSAFLSNDAFDIPSGDRTALVARVDLGAPVDLGSTLLVQTDGINKQVTVPNGGSLFAYLVTVGAFTATAAARQVTLHSIAP
jgi:hypothetical protein